MFCAPLATLAAAADVPDSVLKDESARVAAIAKAMPTVLASSPSRARGAARAWSSRPTATALTNFHVTREAGIGMKCGMADGRLYDAVIVGVDPTGDVALIKLLGRDDFPAAELADSDRVRAGDWCFTVGNPFLLATDFKPSIAYGVVSGMHRYQYPAGTLLEYADCLQVDAAINPGNSGGPLFDAAGPADRHQRPRLVRETRPRERRRRLCHFDQSDQEFPRPAQERPRSSIMPRSGPR